MTCCSDFDIVSAVVATMHCLHIVDAINSHMDVAMLSLHFVNGACWDWMSSMTFFDHTMTATIAYSLAFHCLTVGNSLRYRTFPLIDFGRVAKFVADASGDLRRCSRLNFSFRSWHSKSHESMQIFYSSYIDDMLVE